MRRTTAISWICLALLAGLAFGRVGMSVPWWVPATAAAAVLVTWRSRWLVLAAMILTLMLGMTRAEAVAQDQLRLTSHTGETVTLTGTVSDDPGYDTRGFMDFRVGNLRLENGEAVPGLVKVRMYQINLHRGYQVHLQGKLKPPYYHGPPEMSYPKLSVLSTEQNWLEQFRQRFFAGMRAALPEPVASFGLGLLVGVRGLIPKPLQEELSLVGLSHLVAVSGYNLTIIVAATDRLLERFGRGVALTASLWFIGAFLVVTGASASIVRASIVALLALLAAYYGRRFQPVCLILLVAAATAGYKPDYLLDLGWLLSFLAFFGIMVLAPAVTARLNNPKPLAARLFIESTAAHIITLPLILYFFDDLSVVAPITNLIILPMIPLAMLTGFVAGITGMILPAFAGWLSWPAHIILGGILWFVDQFAALPWAGTTMSLSLFGMLAFYALIGLIILVLQRVNKRLGRQAEDVPDAPSFTKVLH